MKKYTCLFVCLLMSIFSFAQRASFNTNYYIGELNKTLQLSNIQQKSIRSMLTASEQKQKSLQSDLDKLKESGEGNSEVAKQIKKEIRTIKMMDEKNLIELLTEEQKILHAKKRKERKYELQLEKMTKTLTLADSQQAPILALIIDYNTALDSIKNEMNVVMEAKKQQELEAANPPTPVAMEAPIKKKKKKEVVKEIPAPVKTAKIETTIEEKNEQIKQLKIAKRVVVDNYEDSLEELLSSRQLDLYRRDKMLRPMTGKLNQFQRKSGISKEEGDKIKTLLLNYNQRRNKLIDFGDANSNLAEDLKSIKTSFDTQLAGMLKPEQVELFNKLLEKYVK